VFTELLIKFAKKLLAKQANKADETDVKCVVSALYDSNTGDAATDETGTRLVNSVDFSMKGSVALSSQDVLLIRLIWQIINSLYSCQNCNIAMF